MERPGANNLGAVSGENHQLSFDKQHPRSVHTFPLFIFHTANNGQYGLKDERGSDVSVMFLSLVPVRFTVHIKGDSLREAVGTGGPETCLARQSLCIGGLVMTRAFSSPPPGSSEPHSGFSESEGNQLCERGCCDRYGKNDF
ncbi:hypothetical protein COCON_G00184010 [Conger conger]|uniref:Uncharacterized protein n=1 Tax=Conger conger TaxID=82655 RepID=A0A9Q1D697_CONCO|nr:hypothetical protein COCON_G00184010 [Conger conger]